MSNHVAERIKTLRQQYGLTEEYLSQELHLSKAAYYDLEAYDDELETCVSFAQLQKLATIFQVTMLYLLIGTDYPENFSQSTSFQQIIENVHAYLERSHKTRIEFEECLGWDLTAFLEHAQHGFEMPIFFFWDICQSLNIDWKSVIYQYEPKREQYRNRIRS